MANLTINMVGPTIRDASIFKNGEQLKDVTVFGLLLDAEERAFEPQCFAIRQCGCAKGDHAPVTRNYIIQSMKVEITYDDTMEVIPDQEDKEGN